MSLRGLGPITVEDAVSTSLRGGWVFVIPGQKGSVAMHPFAAVEGCPGKGLGAKRIGHHSIVSIQAVFVAGNVVIQPTGVPPHLII
jgi:hypothetical protein